MKSNAEIKRDYVPKSELIKLQRQFVRKSAMWFGLELLINPDDEDSGGRKR